MQIPAIVPREESLDPADWSSLREIGHRMLDDMMNYIETINDRPVWQKPAAESIAAMDSPLPVDPSGMESVYEDFVEQVLPYNVTNGHPRFWAWVQGSGTPFGMLADMLASGMNPNVSIGNHMPMYVEQQVLNWSKQLFGFPQQASGILTSGASMANITALNVARNHFNPAIKQKGLSGMQPMTVYGSAETHQCVIKGVESIGVGSDHFRRVPVDEKYQVRTDLLAQMIAEDRRAGFQPFCIVGNAGTVNTGAIDDLSALALLAKKEKMWFHIDGAFGAVPKLLPEFNDRLKGIEEADSLSFDFHKWFYMNYEVGCVLIRDAAAHKNAFSSSVNYLLQHERGLSAGPENYSNYGLELSRGFKALKVWMLLKEHGIKKYQRLIRQNLAQAQYTAELIAKEPELELLADTPLNIVCYRYNAGDCTSEKLNALNKEILMRLHEEGIAAPSYTILRGQYAIRLAITNHRSRKADFRALVQETIRLGRELLPIVTSPR